MAKLCKIHVKKYDPKSNYYHLEKITDENGDPFSFVKSMTITIDGGEIQKFSKNEDNRPYLDKDGKPAMEEPEPFDFLVFVVEE